MEELRKIVRVLRKHDESLPHEALLVIDGNTGQNAASQAQGFTSVIPLSGLVITKLDGSAKGGAVLALCRAYDVPVKWLGMGESMEDWVPFDPDAFSQGLFGNEEPEKPKG
jgi:fused signal recognition particle receptor